MQRDRRCSARGLGLATLLIATVAHAGALADDWTPIYPGVDYLERRTGVPQDIHVVRVDLDEDELRLRATRAEHKGRTTSSFAATYGCEIAVNADFFSAGFAPSGLAVGGGERWSGTADTSSHGFVAAGADNRVAIPRVNAVVDPPKPWMEEVVGGNRMLVLNGEQVDNSGCGGFCDRHPRTAAGLSEDGTKLFLAVVDGRSTASAGATLNELAALMHEVGAHRALNLDGGGSTAMYVRNLGGIVNRPSDGTERTVANHLGVCLDGAFGEVTGYVREGDIYEEEAGVAGARVVFSSGQETTTDEAGRYRVRGVPAGEVVITATAPGLSGERDLEVVADELRWGSIALEPVPDAGAPDAGSAGPRPDAGDSGGGPEIGSDAGVGSGGAAEGSGGGCAIGAVSGDGSRSVALTLMLAWAFGLAARRYGRSQTKG